MMTQLSGALQIDYLETPLGGRIGMTHCLGRNTIDGQGRQWQRVLVDDIQTVSHANIHTVISLITLSELKKLGGAELPELLKQHQINWLQIPIEDFGTPDQETLEAWRAHVPTLLQLLKHKKTILLHCAAGLGRTGMMAAALLVACGVAPATAIAQVRQVRPGTIETIAQAQFILTLNH